MSCALIRPGGLVRALSAPISRALISLALLALPGDEAALAQVKVHTETIHPPGTTLPPAANQFVPSPPGPDAPAHGASEAHGGEPPGATGSLPPAAHPEIATDSSHLPPAVMHMRERILAAARTGDLQALLALMREGGSAPIFSHTQRQDPAAYWKENYPDSDGIEILAILIGILDTEPVRTNAGTPQEMYVWPYFARLPIASLTPAQKVELFRVVTGSDYKTMLERGRYIFYQVGISPDGAWRYFLASE